MHRFGEGCADLFRVHWIIGLIDARAIEHGIEPRCKAQVLLDITITGMGYHAFHGDDGLEIFFFHQAQGSIIEDIDFPMTVAEKLIKIDRQQFSETTGDGLFFCLQTIAAN